jgi:hypothetical protein
MKLLLQLYHAAAAGPASTPLAERCAAAGGVPAELVGAFQAVLEDGKLDGSFKVRDATYGVRGSVFGIPYVFTDVFPSFGNYQLGGSVEVGKIGFDYGVLGRCFFRTVVGSGLLAVP